MFNQYKKANLGFFPTPLMELKNLSQMLNGPKIFMKRDDQTGLALGGNKTRKLEYLLGDALNHGATTIITAGAIQSNHCRQTAAAAAKLGLECHLILGGKNPEHCTGNLLLNNLLGAHIHWAGENRKGEDIPSLVQQLKKQGQNPYVVPYGGSNELGALAYVEARIELDKQLKAMNEEITHIVFASSSGATHAGIMVGNQIVHSNSEVIGINIDKGETGDIPLDEVILTLATNTAKMVDLKYIFNHQDVVLNADYFGGGYGVIGKLENEAITLTAKSEGILLDPVYTGRAMGGLLDLIKIGRFKQSDKVLFWHTGGAPALFAYNEQLMGKTHSAHR